MSKRGDPRPPSGEQFELRAANQHAVVVEVGAGLRAYAAAGVDVVDPYAVDAICDGAHGAVLMPWPNRLAGGRYRFAGAEQQLALSEPERGNAIHGLLRWRPWRALERDAGRIVMATNLDPTPGYPFALEARVAYELLEQGLRVTTTATNVGAAACPFGAGHHPYLSAAGSLDECELLVPAATRLVSDGHSGLPTGAAPVRGTAFDFNESRRIGAARLDDAFTDLTRGGADEVTVRLHRADERVAELWVEESFRYLQLYSGDTLAPDRRRRGLAVEPMTCPANAFQSGAGLLVLAPGETFTGRWGMRILAGAA